jgi:glycosyltransferase involved in cell wall biosynthesis
MKLSSDQPLVSVIVLCYNQADIISRAVESVLNQTYRNLQLVLVDDCSKDNSKEVILDWYKKHPDRIKYFFQPQNAGHPKNMNTGYRLCDGELITFCDGDDWYYPEKVEKEVNFLINHPETDVVHSNYDFYTIDGKFIKHWALKEDEIPQGDIFRQLFALQYPYCSHLRYEMTSRKILEEAGYYDDSIPVWVDWDLRLRLAAKYKFGYVHYVGSAYTENPVGVTMANKQETILKFLERVIEKNKPHLLTYPPGDVSKIMKAINFHVRSLRLAVNFRKGNHSVSETIKYLADYPKQITNWRMIGNSMFGMKFMKSLSAFKQKIITGKQST